MTTAPARLGTIMVDCQDPATLFPFWAEVLGVEIEATYTDYIFSTKIPGSDIRIAFQRVSEDKSTKNRLHLDLRHENPESFVATVEGLGGSQVEAHNVDDFHWVILADPEGNEFCLVTTDQ